MRAIKNKLEAFGSSNQHVRLMTSNELDKCLREALYSDTVGCSDSILFDISQATYHEAFFERIMKAAWSCVGSRASRIRRIQKGLNLLNYLAINGSERCISDIIGHIDVLHSLPKLKFGKNNNELSMLVIEKASQLSALVLDSKTLQDKRKYAASIRDRFVSVGSTNGFVETDVLHKPVYVLDKTKNVPHDMSGLNGMSLGFGGIHGSFGMHSKAANRLAINQMTTKHSGRKFLSRLFRNSLKVSDNPHNMGLFGNQQNSFADYQVTGANLGYGMGGYGDMSTGMNRYGTPNYSSNMNNYGASGYTNPQNNYVSGSYTGRNSCTGRNSYNGVVGSNTSNFSPHNDEFNAFPSLNNTNDSYYKHSFAGARSANKTHKRSIKLGSNRASANRAAHRVASHTGSKSDDSSFKYQSSTTGDSSYSSTSSSSSSDSESSYSSRGHRTYHRYEGRPHGSDNRAHPGRHSRHTASGYHRRSTYSDTSESSDYSDSESEYESSDYYESGDRHFYKGANDRHAYQDHGHYNNVHSAYSAPASSYSYHPKAYTTDSYGYDRYDSPDRPHQHHHYDHDKDSGAKFNASQRHSASHRPSNLYSTDARAYASAADSAPRHNHDHRHHSDEYQDHHAYSGADAGSAPVNHKHARDRRDRHHDSYYDRPNEQYSESRYNHKYEKNNNLYKKDRFNDKYDNEKYSKYEAYKTDTFHDRYSTPAPATSSYTQQQNPFTRT